MTFQLPFIIISSPAKKEINYIFFLNVKIKDYLVRSLSFKYSFPKASKQTNNFIMQFFYQASCVIVEPLENKIRITQRAGKANFFLDIKFRNVNICLTGEEAV